MANVLLVDDSSLVRSQMRTLLESGRHMVLEASNGLKALNVLETHASVQLIITDINMPEMDGISFCKLLRADPIHANVRVFALTTEVSTELKIAGKEAGILLWIQKAADGKLLLGTIEKILGQN